MTLILKNLKQLFQKKNFLDTVKYRCQDFGKVIDVEYAEGFTAERCIGVKSLDDII